MLKMMNYQKRKEVENKMFYRYSSKLLNKSLHFAGCLDNKHVLDINIPFIQYRIYTHIYL